LLYSLLIGTPSQLIWNRFPIELEQCSRLAGTGFHLNDNAVRGEKA